LGGTGISGGPYSSVVSAGALAKLAIITRSEERRVGEEWRSPGTVLDEFDNPVTGVGGDLAGSVSGANTATLTFAAGTTAGTYAATYTPTVAGTDVFARTLGGTGISGGPYSSVVSGGALAKLAIIT